MSEQLYIDFRDGFTGKALRFLENIEAMQREIAAKEENEYRQALEKPYCGCEFCYEPFGPPPVQGLLFVSYGVYARDRNYGGPEEGGWWYDSYELLDDDLVVSLPRNSNMFVVKKALVSLVKRALTRHPHLNRDELFIKHETSYRPQLHRFYPQHSPHYC